MSALVPTEWTRMIGNLRAAQVARDTMKNREATQIARDDATQQYCRAVDAMVDDLTRLSETQFLSRITLRLSRREGR